VLEACLSPAGLTSLLLASGILVISLRRTSRIGPRILGIGSAMFLAIVATPFAELVYARLEHFHAPMLHADPSAKAVVVLAGYGENLAQLPVTSKLSVETIARTVEGVRLYRELQGSKLVFSGGIARRHDEPVARLMADFAISLGVPAKDIVIEGRSTTTYENLVEVKKIVGAEPFILVTSGVELRRAMAVARKLDMRALGAPAAIWASRYYPAGMSWHELGLTLLADSGYPKAHRFVYLQRAYHEYVGYIWYWALGRV
jgi:uncharacterized SAM-binding protein YcdF (DUF218 family)